MIVGYARVFTPEQDLDALLDRLRADDIVVVAKYDRLARACAAFARWSKTSPRPARPVLAPRQQRFR